MDVPNTAAGLLVVLLGVLPGMPGDYLYRVIIGVSWREKDTTHLLRLLAFSVLGLIAYALLANRFGWSLPEYVIPSTFVGPTFNAGRFGPLGLAYLGHFAGSAVVSVLAAAATNGLARIRAVSATRDSWDHFVRCAVPDHWIVVTLQNGDTYAGVLDHADVSTDPQFRDLLVAEPYVFDPTTGKYKPTYQQYLFLRGSDVASIAAVHDPDKDKRIVPVGESPFPEAKS